MYMFKHFGDLSALTRWSFYENMKSVNILNIQITIILA